MDLLLIRHGQSNANAKGLLISNRDDQLTEIGRQQSLNLAKTLEIFNFNKPSLIFSSPWLRAKQTAELIFSEKYLIRFDERLAETNPGKFGTWLEADFNLKYPEFSKNIKNEYADGESHFQMSTRVCNWVDTILMPLSQEPGLIAIVAHGGPISVILQKLLGMKVELSYPSFTVPNASFTNVRWRYDLNRYCLERVGHV
ncbi:histidine phosphatase family protein [Actimicrobium sp. CCC2.4]|uniref:histidine phosphatase family protein n=1 Tax=Actimicrobium sp. CCC2.4 TaxID=3048606 RepID=UPI002AC905FC|nr:histidine phosphatase family protein [Actimicrobium sp. CCC2.4]MEB0136052.1 histidine phosphatase family protein [Actimicrobium sp. CCC2.4]WPX32190.1 histidine phosphatase family protein [Actimicrobium sp. CCC2.4]